jgi:hypothetical protein
LARAWKRLPVLGQAFVVLAIVDLVVRALGVGGLSLFIDLSQPLTIIGFLPHLAFVLFPVVVLLRRPDAATATPLVLWGAVALSLVDLLSGPLFAVFPGIGDNLETWTLLQVLAVAGRGGGYICVALGLTALTRAAPSTSVLGLSNLVTFLIGGAAATSILLVLLQPATDYGEAGWTSQIHLVNMLGPLQNLAFAFLARVVVLGSVDLRRPVVATYTATGAIVLAAILDFFTLALNVLFMVQLALAISPGLPGPGVGFAFQLIGTGLVGVLLVVAFGLGLADTSVRVPRRGTYAPIPPGAERDPVHWPEPGGEVPTFRPVERQAPAEQPAAPGSTSAKPARTPRRTASQQKEPPG